MPIELNLKKRVRGWVMFDWATQPLYTLGLTFIFGPYFVSVSAEYFSILVRIRPVPMPMHNKYGLGVKQLQAYSWHLLEF